MFDCLFECLLVCLFVCLCTCIHRHPAEARQVVERGHPGLVRRLHTLQRVHQPPHPREHHVRVPSDGRRAGVCALVRVYYHGLLHVKRKLRDATFRFKF